MPATILDGKAMAKAIRQDVARDVARLREVGLTPGLAVVLVGDDPASHTYVRAKAKACREVGIHSEVLHLPADTTETALLDTVRRLNERDDIHGILVQLPLPAHIRPKAVIDTLRPDKDVDGFHPLNVGNLAIGDRCLVPCTPRGILEMVKRAGLEVAGKRAVVIGRSNIVGKPMAQLLLREDATVTVCHSKTPNLPDVAREADLLVVAIGRPAYVDDRFVKPGAVVIDVGINRLADGRLVGDVDFAKVQRVAGYLTPVPGGVGPMTIAMLLKNTVEAAAAQVKAAS
ncbi:MAG: bifunctional methylenetetrahydrofolate dehydrogenase/methenyltetrahydrofolate cyclohydrolase FolD [Calditerricola sp.]|nr:bifunctional methylenetetrahydrofolate dehydrogenase/methenyltetrahydrofolate cyclohydrolase FolD [Bacillota bacterium]MCG0313863.1 bifunctional methylenetetrahydrofolate dehydrogenase/methenyltetrahydrofolate cyclohydrolase FolD [Calditerricola sp.]